LTIEELEDKLDEMASEAFKTETYTNITAPGSYVIKLSDLLIYTDTEDVFVNPETKNPCDKESSMVILDIKEENGVLKRTISSTLVCNE